MKKNFTRKNTLSLIASFGFLVASPLKAMVTPLDLESRMEQSDKSTILRPLAQSTVRYASLNLSADETLTIEQDEDDFTVHHLQSDEPALISGKIDVPHGVAVFVVPGGLTLGDGAALPGLGRVIFSLAPPVFSSEDNTLSFTLPADKKALFTVGSIAINEGLGFFTSDLSFTGQITGPMTLPNKGTVWPINFQQDGVVSLSSAEHEPMTNISYIGHINSDTLIHNGYSPTFGGTITLTSSDEFQHPQG